MKILSYIAVTLFSVFLLLYVILFTPVGNHFIAPLLNNKISQVLKLPVNVENFRLTTSNINMALNIDTKNKVIIEGKYSLFSQNFNIEYDLFINNLSSFSKLANKQLQGKMNTKGNIKGDLEKIAIKGYSDIASGSTFYTINLLNNKLQNLHMETENVLISELFYIAKQKEILNGKMNINADITNFNEENLSGKVKGFVTNGSFNKKLIKNDFNITIPNTAFKSTFNATIDKNIEYNVNFDSNLARLDSKGRIDPVSLNINSDFRIFIAKLELLESLTNTKLKGDLSLKGKIVGDKKQSFLTLRSDLAKSDTNLHINLKEFRPVSIEGEIKMLNMHTLLYMLDQPAYLKAGNLDMDININSLSKGNMDGTINTIIKSGILNDETIKKYFDQNIPKNTTLTANLDTKLEKNLAVTKGSIKSSLADISVKELTYNIKNDILTTNNKITINDFSRLEPIIGRKLRGEALIDLKAKSGNDLKIDIGSKILQGDLKIGILNEHANIHIKDIDINDLSYMLYYPQIYTGKANGRVKADTKKQKADFDLDLKNGHFTKNELTDLVLQTLKLDLTKEIFSKALIKGTRNKNIINTDIYMESPRLIIKSRKSVIDTEKQLIDTILTLKHKHYVFDVKIKGDINSPRISSNIGEIILKEKAKKELKKKMKDKLDDKMKGLFDNFLNNL